MSQYQQLIRNFCSLVDVPQADAIAQGAPIEVNGIVCSIAAGAREDVDGLVLYIDFGAVASGREARIYEELLVQNYLGSPYLGVMFGYSPGDRRVICMQHLRASEVTPQQLVDILHHIAEKAVEWRSNFFLERGKEDRAESNLPASAGAAALLRAARPLADKTIG